jgi:hypothetical protein
MTANLLQERTNASVAVLEGFRQKAASDESTWLRLECDAERFAIGRTYNNYYASVGRVVQLRQVAVENNQAGRFNQMLVEFKTRHRLKSALISLLDRRVQPI